jgi:hypothetical protein
MAILMSKIDKIKQAILALQPKELAAFRKWFRQFDSDMWDHQIEEDLKAGKLDQLGNSVLKAHKEGKSSEL